MTRYISNAGTKINKIENGFLITFLIVGVTVSVM